MASWIETPADSDFSTQNIPFGVFSSPDNHVPRCATRIGDTVVDLAVLHKEGLLSSLSFDTAVFEEASLNAFMGLSRAEWRATRTLLQALLAADGEHAASLRDNERVRAAALRPVAEATMHLPAQIGDYTDFYSSREHATNVGIMFRGVDNALQPNWLHLPVGYHGRSSSVVVSGTPVVRPRGQLQRNNENPKDGSTYGACRLMDYELEMAFFYGGSSNAMGKPLAMEEAEDHLFGVVLMNDWSARDIQKWEYVPLGPFTAKNFATTISPWVVTLDALEPFRTQTSAGEAQTDPEPLPYLVDPAYGRSTYDLNLSVAIKPVEEPSAEGVVTQSNMRYLYWNMKQQLVHHTVTGCNFKPGDLCGSGTISGPENGNFGSLLELCWKGSREVVVKDSESEEDRIVRKFLKDGDEVVIRGFCQGEGFRVGFGDCSGLVLPAGSRDGEEQQEEKKEEEEEEATARYTNFKLYSYWRSTCSWRVRLALALKGLSYEYEAVHLVKDGGEQNQAAYKDEVNPMAQVPTLQFEDSWTGQTHRLTQSAAIIEFLDEAFPGSHILPSALAGSNALERAEVREIVQMVNSGIQPMQNLVVLQKVTETEFGDGRAFAAEMIRKGLLALEQKLAGKGTRFCCGNSLSMADLYVIPQLYNARRFELDMSAFPTLTAIESHCEGLPAFQQAHPSNQPDAQN
jgi:fumarylacetoacetase